jgi:hypothetical protein
MNATRQNDRTRAAPAAAPPPSAAPAAAPRLSEWVPLQDMPSVKPDMVPTLSAALWQARVHRAALVQGKALILIGRKVFVHPERYLSVLIEIGLQAAAKRVA